MNKAWLDQLKQQLNFRLKSRVPPLLQTEAAECGLTCLVMICRYYRKDVDLLSLRQQFAISSHGATLAVLIHIANKIGLDSRPLSLELEELSCLKRPCILHWDLNHFVVLVAIKAKKVIIHDPAFGRRCLTLNELSLHFTGVALELWPNAHFASTTQRQRLSFSSLLNNIDGLSSFLIKIFALSLLLESINLLIPVGTQLVMDHVILAKDHGLLTLICLGLFCFTLFRTLISMFRAWIGLLMDTFLNLQWKNGFFDHLLQLPLGYFEKRNPGDIQSRFYSLDFVRTTLTSGLVSGVLDGIMTLGLMLMMYLYAGWLLWVVLGFTLLYVLLRLLTFGSYRQAAEEKIVKEARSNSHFMETMYAMSTVKALGLNPIRTRTWMNLNIDTTNAGIRIARLDMLYGGVNALLTTLDQILILWLGASMVIEQQLTLGMFVAFNLYRGQFAERSTQLIDLVLQLRMLSLHNERLADIALTTPEAQVDNQTLIQPHQAASLEIKNLSYAYDALSVPIIHNLSLRIQPRESVAIVGPSGVGKSTLLKLMTGLIQPQQGHLLFNDRDIDQLGLAQYRQVIACVLQDDSLFAGSVADNIACFDLDKDQDRILEVAKACNIDVEIMNMPMGFETLISELGSSLSGGQVQRLLIARALYRRPAILFMDEATSHLDTHNEALINQSIKALNITRVFIAHRQSTIDSADRVFEMVRS
ncbi:colicin V processing peptidase [Acinetobacter calcoaceticus]|uniref:Colicin V processing peptidase n=1 Tax=Acinetobacter calcoaceticus TaxID=471 RepID=A0A4R1XWY7_ACICA|nr:colicin V processing peptidase [Acinetobacter calcoaceticus]